LVQLIDIELYLKHELDEIWRLIWARWIEWRLICCSSPSICLKSYHTFLFRY
jgi:hypothetical protein